MLYRNRLKRIYTHKRTYKPVPYKRLYEVLLLQWMDSLYEEALQNKYPNPCKDIKLPYEDITYHLHNYQATGDTRELDVFNKKVKKN